MTNIQISSIQIFFVALRLGLTSFGGPAAHIGLFHAEYVTRRRWLSEQQFAELLALSNFLPGPASSQVGFGIGHLKAGIPGAIAAWLGFTLPSFFFMTGAAIALPHLPAWVTPVLEGIFIATIVIILDALISMFRNFVGTKSRQLVVFSLVLLILLFYSSALSQIITLGLAAIFGSLFLHPRSEATSLQKAPASSVLSIRQPLVYLFLFILLLVTPFLVGMFMKSPSVYLELTRQFLYNGTLIFGGGHALFPFLQQNLVESSPSLLSPAEFQAGYSFAQMMPGPLFTIASFIGYCVSSGWFGSIVATIAIFTPGFLLMLAILPIWGHIRQFARIRMAITGVCIAVVGILAYAAGEALIIHSFKNVFSLIFFLTLCVLIIGPTMFPKRMSSSFYRIIKSPLLLLAIGGTGYSLYAIIQNMI